MTYLLRLISQPAHLPECEAEVDSGLSLGPGSPQCTGEELWLAASSDGDSGDNAIVAGDRCNHTSSRMRTVALARPDNYSLSIVHYAVP
jgi:hypothetical protein